MGNRKLKVGRCHKNFERKRQINGTFAVGRPPKGQRKNKGYDKPAVSVL